MSGKSGATMILAVVCGLGAMFGARRLLSKDNAPVETVNVVVAARDLKVEEVIKEDMLTTKQFSKDRVPAGSFAKPEGILDRWVRITMLADEPIVEPKLAPKDLPPGLVGSIPKGKRAFAVEVNESTGVSGFVLPNHRVDVIQAGDSDDREFGGMARTLLENMLVLAAGQVTARPDDKSIQVRTVTLAVTPEEAEVLVAARENGPIALSLRGIGDDAPMKPKPKPAPEPEPEIAEEPEPPALPVFMPPPAKPHKHILIFNGYNGRPACVAPNCPDR